MDNEQLKQDIETIYHKYKGIYGYRRVYIYIRKYLNKSKLQTCLPFDENTQISYSNTT